MILVTIFVCTKCLNWGRMPCNLYLISWINRVCFRTARDLCCPLLFEQCSKCYLLAIGFAKFFTSKGNKVDRVNLCHDSQTNKHMHTHITQIEQKLHLGYLLLLATLLTFCMTSKLCWGLQ
ncbi:hypothetical protein XENTR_v10021405 [Xenopus tropicalis]|nr:hypothetical protein XENTR_v10021405 [Xenopus tropicalis]